MDEKKEQQRRVIRFSCCRLLFAARKLVDGSCSTAPSPVPWHLPAFCPAMSAAPLRPRFQSSAIRPAHPLAQHTCHVMLPFWSSPLAGLLWRWWRGPHRVPSFY